MNPPPKQLYIDDIRTPPDDAGDWDIARTSQDALRLIQQADPPYILISFDHDLGLLPDGSCDTTMPVARYIEEMCFQGIQGQGMVCPRYVIHSANPVGRSNLLRCLQQAEMYSRIAQKK